VRTKEFKPELVPALAAVTGDIGAQVKEHGSLSRVPAEAVANVRNDMYLSSETIRFLEKSNAANFDADTKVKLKAFKKQIDDATKFIPMWVKVSIAIARQVPWSDGRRRYGGREDWQDVPDGAQAPPPLVAMLTSARRTYGLPVSTTHARRRGRHDGGQKSGLQMSTIRNCSRPALTLPQQLASGLAILAIFAPG
jgi:PiT family inorganic phosphate transporter